LRSALLWSVLLAGLVFPAELNRIGTLGSGGYTSGIMQALLMSGFLMLACLWDLRWRRIPNWLNAGGLLAVLLASVVGLLGDTGPADRAFGALAGFGVLLVGHLAGMFGAGDVKAAAVLGAFWGTGDVINGLLCSIVAGGLIATVLLWANGRLGFILSRLVPVAIASLPVFVRVFGSDPNARNEALASKETFGVPFACAFALGAFALGMTGFDW